MTIFNVSNQGRMDVFLTSEFKGEFSRVEIQNFIKESRVSVNKNIVKKPSFLLKNGDEVEVNIKSVSFLKNNRTNITSKEMDIEIVFENENLLIINKPVGLTVHPGAGNINNTLVNGLLAMMEKGETTLSNERGNDRLGIVHRLDKDTSGLMIIAKNNKIHRLLGEMIKRHDIDRRYITLLHGVPVPSAGKIENYICRSRKDIKKMQICNSEEWRSKIAITNYRVLKVLNNNETSVVECKLETGRTHQIRLHMQYIKHPIIGEQLYTSSNLKQRDFYNGYTHQMLHSYKLYFKEPITGEEIFIENYPEWKEIKSLF